MESSYKMTIAGLERELPLCPVNEHLQIAAFLMLGDAELTEACAAALIRKLPAFDYLITPEAKSIPLIAEMARQLKAPWYIVARKGAKLYMHDPLCCEVRSITTDHVQKLYVDRTDADRMRGRRIVIVDDVISTGESLAAVEHLVGQAGGTVVGRMAVLAEGDASKRPDVTYLEPLPLFIDGEATL